MLTADERVWKQSSPTHHAMATAQQVDSGSHKKKKHKHRQLQHESLSTALPSPKKKKKKRINNIQL